jgi:CHAD domain-containing protein
MGEKPGLRRDRPVGAALDAFAQDILAEAHAALDNPHDALAVHDFRKAMKRWRAFLRLLEPLAGAPARDLRDAARDLARELAAARDGQSALDALADLGKHDELPARSIATVTGRLDALRATAEQTALTETLRARLKTSLEAAHDALAEWALADATFDDIASALSEGYGRARRAIPPDWSLASDEQLHELRQRVVVHRYQMELVEPLWPRLGKLWVAEAQRLRERLGTCQDLAVLARLSEPHQPLAPWRSRLAPLIAARRSAHVEAATRLAQRLFAERPKAFRRRLLALWDSSRQAD